MKKIILSLIFYAQLSFSGSISGTIESIGKVPGGTLFIFAKNYKSRMPMPLAVKKVKNPTFPIKFELSDKDKMMPQMPFKGPFKVVARISPTGNAMDKSGIEVSTESAIEMGTKNIKLILKGK